MVKKVGYFMFMLMILAYMGFSNYRGVKFAIEMLNTPDDGKVLLGVLMMILVLTSVVLAVVVIKSVIKRLKELGS